MKKIQQENYDQYGKLISLSCIECFIVKDIDDFFKSKQRKIGYKAHCKQCQRKSRQLYYENNKDKVLKQTRKYWVNNHEKHKEWEKNWRDKHKEQTKNRRKEKAKQNPSLKLKNTISRRILLTLKKQNVSKTNYTTTLLGCDIETAKRWIENQFTEQMSWANHGSLWHLDHIIPCCSFDLTKQSQQMECFNYTNLRPLLASENLKKAALDKKRSLNAATAASIAMNDYVSKVIKKQTN